MRTQTTIPPEVQVELDRLRSWKEPYRLLTQKEVIEEFAIPREDLRAAQRSGVLPCRRSGRRLLFARQHVRDWIDATSGHTPDNIRVSASGSSRRVGDGRSAMERSRQLLQQQLHGGVS